MVIKIPVIKTYIFLIQKQCTLFSCLNFHNVQNYMFEDFEQKLESAELKYLKNSGKSFLTQIKKIQTKFKAAFDQINKPVTKSILSQLKSFMNVYQILSLELCDTCRAVQADSFGQCIVRMFEQILNILKFLLSSLKMKTEKQNEQSLVKFTQIGINDSERNKPNQYKIKKNLKDISDRSFSLGQKIADPQAVMRNLKESKQKVMSVKSSDAKIILDQAIRAFKTKGQYLQRFVAFRQNYLDMIQNQNTVAEEYLENIEKNKNKEKAIAKLKNIFSNFLLNKLKAEKTQDQKSKSFPKKVNEKKFDIKQKQNERQKIKDLKAEIQIKNIEKKALQFEVQQVKKYYNNKIIELSSKNTQNQPIEKQIFKDEKTNTFTQCLLIGEQESNPRKKSYLIKNKASRLKLQKKTFDLCLIKSIASQNINDQLGIKIDSVNQLKKSIRLKRRFSNNIQIKNKIHESQREQNLNQIFQVACLRSARRQAPQTQRQNHRQTKIKKFPAKRGQKQIISPFQKPDKMHYQQQSEIFIETKQFFKIKRIEVATFSLNKQILSELFLTIENGRNYQNLYVSEKVLKKKIQHNNAIKKEKSGKQGNHDHEIGLSQIIKIVWELIQSKKKKNKQHYWQLCLFFRYPYSSISHEFSSRWKENLLTQPSLTLNELGNILKKAYGFHSKCEAKVECSNIENICPHWTQFLMRLGIVFIPQ